MIAEYNNGIPRKLEIIALNAKTVSVTFMEQWLNYFFVSREVLNNVLFRGVKFSKTVKSTNSSYINYDQ
jgi:hypothetical protein